MELDDHAICQLYQWFRFSRDQDWEQLGELSTQQMEAVLTPKVRFPRVLRGIVYGVFFPVFFIADMLLLAKGALFGGASGGPTTYFKDWFINPKSLATRELGYQYQHRSSDVSCQNSPVGSGDFDVSQVPVQHVVVPEKEEYHRPLRSRCMRLILDGNAYEGEW